MSLELTGVHGLLKRHKLFTHKKRSTACGILQTVLLDNLIVAKVSSLSGTFVSFESPVQSAGPQACCSRAVYSLCSQIGFCTRVSFPGCPWTLRLRKQLPIHRPALLLFLLFIYPVFFRPGNHISHVIFITSRPV